MDANARNGHQYRQMARQLVLAGLGMRLLSADGQVRSSGAGYAVPGAVEIAGLQIGVVPGDWWRSWERAGTWDRDELHGMHPWHGTHVPSVFSDHRAVHMYGTGYVARDWIVGNWDRRYTEKSGVLQRGTADREQMCWILQDGRCVAVHGGCVVTVGVTGKGLDVVVDT